MRKLVGASALACAMLAASTLTASALIAQRGTNAAANGIDAKANTLLWSDTADFNSVALSASGKWLVFGRSGTGAGTSNLWLASVPNGKPVALTTPGYRDRAPALSPSGDRVYFLSNRADRAGGNAQYIMVLPLGANGAPTGPARQVSTEAVQTFEWLPISPDGQSLVYASREKPGTLKIIPANGGLARVLATSASDSGAVSAFAFSRDGKHVMYQDLVRGAAVLKRVSVDGGSAATMFDGKGANVAPYPLDEALYVSRPRLVPGGTSLQLMNGAGTSVSAISVASNGPAGTVIVAPRGDGRGIVSARNDIRIETRVRPITGGAIGAPRIVAPPSLDRPVGTDADGNIVMRRTVDGRQVAAFVGARGNTTRTLDLPAGVTAVGSVVAGGRMFTGSASGAVQRGAFVPAYVQDAKTGQTRTISQAAYRWLYDQGDKGVTVIERNGDAAEAKTVTSAGVSSLVHRWMYAQFDSMWHLSIVGQRTAYGYSNRTLDSVRVFVTDGVAGDPKLVMTVPKTANGYFEIALSPSGKRLVVTADADARVARLYAVELTANGTAAGPARRAMTEASFASELTWLPDESAFLYEGDLAPVNLAGKTALFVQPFDTSKPANAITKDEPGEVSGYALASDGKSIVYGMRQLFGAVIWTASFERK